MCRGLELGWRSLAANRRIDGAEANGLDEATTRRRRRLQYSARCRGDAAAWAASAALELLAALAVQAQPVAGAGAEMPATGPPALQRELLNS